MISILAVWVATLGFHVKRLYFRPASEVLADAARTIPPGTSYYVVTREDRRVGWAQSDVDTLPGATGFRLRERLSLERPLVPGLEPLRLEIDATLSPTFSLARFVLRAAGVPGIREVEGEVHGDSTLTLRIRDTATVREERVPLEEPVVVAAAWPLRFAAEREVKAGSSYELRVYDPLSGQPRPMRITVLAEAVRTFPDSVTAEDGRWITAREDTVRAWHVRHDVSGLAFDAWVDEDGRLLEASLPGGLRLTRTAFELAYFGAEVPARLPTDLAPREPGSEPEPGGANR